MSSQEPGRADQHVPGRVGPLALLVLLQRGVDDLEVVEGRVLPQHGAGQHGEESVRARRGRDVVGHEPRRLFDLLLRVHRFKQARAEVVRRLCTVGLRHALGRHVQESVEVDTYRRVEHGAEEFDRRCALQRLV